MANRISTVLDLDGSGFKSTLKGIGTSIGDADGVMGKFKAGAKGTFDGLKQYSGEAALAAGAALVAFGVKALGVFTDTAKAALDLGTATGLYVEDASRWIAVADDMGVSAEALQSGIGKIAKTLDDSKWDKFGVATRDAGGEARSVNDILLDTFDKLGKITNETQRAVEGNKLFGKGYASLSPLIGKTREEMEDYLGEVEKGQVITKEEVAKAEKMRLAQDALADAYKEITLAVGGMVAGLAPMVEQTADATTKLVDLAEKVENATSKIGGLKGILDIVAGGNPVAVFNKMVDAFTEVVPQTEAATKALAEMSLTTDDATGFAKELIDAVKDEEKAAADLKAGFDNLTKGIIDEYTAQREATQAAIDAIPGMADLDQSIRDLDTSYYNLQTQIFENAVLQKDAEVADRDKEQSSRDLASAEHDMAGEVFATAQKFAEQAGATEGSKAQADLMRESLEKAKAKYPELVDEINGYINALMRIPGAVFTEVNLRSSQTGGPRIALAEGGYVPPRPGGTDVTLAEAGKGEFVIPEDKVVTAGGGGPLIENFHVHVMGSADQVTRDLAKFVRRNGPGPLRQLLGIN